jgi:transcriptional regulator with XRE-family HTH domain
MTGNPTDAQTDRLIRARLCEIGLSQADLAELLEAAFQSPAKNGDRPAAPDAGRLAEVAAALGLPARPEKAAPSSPEGWGSQQSLFELRLLRAFCELRDPRAQRMLVYLAEQLATCAGRSPGDAG